MATVIIGAGIIGTSTAYYLSLSQTPNIHLIESCPELFASASGYAAGFLAREWFAPASASLGLLSFDLHKKLAEEHNGYEIWGYSRSTAPNLAETIGEGEEEDWMGQGTSRAKAAKRIAENDDPRPVWLAPRHGKPDIIDQGDGLPKTLPRSKIQVPISSLAGHSLLLRSSHWPPRSLDTGSNTMHPGADDSEGGAKAQPPCHALFTTDHVASYGAELFSRLPSGHIYIAGLNGPYPLPSLPTERIIDPKAIEILKGTAESLLGKDEFRVEREALCWRPTTGRGVPIVGPAKNTRGEGERAVWIAAGHGPWGISMSLGTGYVVAEMVEGRETSADVKGLRL
ncbi:MAG: hypothetical protein Q9226_000958 [Calogaya cf. arnoldii]